MRNLRMVSSLLPACRPCGQQCCRYSTPILDRKERDRIVAATGKDCFVEVQAATGAGSYFVVGRKLDGSPRSIAPDAGGEGDPCSFLAPDGRCSIQDQKPLDCAAYPLRAVPLADGALSWHLHRGCPAHAQLSADFLDAARQLAAASARRFAPPVYADWLWRFSRWTLEPEAAWRGEVAQSDHQAPAAPQWRTSAMPLYEPAEGDANQFMRDTVRLLADRQPGLRDRGGRAFWPVPALFPLLLVHCLHQVQRQVSELYLAAHDREAAILAACRCNLLRLVAEGDLGEDHAALFLADHPGIAAIAGEEYRQLPFYGFCQDILRIDDPILLLGALMRNEAGSLGEMEALLAENLISPGRFSAAHLVEEVTHARLADEIAERLSEFEALNRSFNAGQALHDRIYAAVACPA
jgi:Fe-S-cluster containining protein